MRKLISVLSAVALAGGVFVAVSPAIAAPIPGCSFVATKPSLSGTKVRFGGTASCSSAGTARWLYATLYHNYDVLPDKPVTSWFDSGKKTSYNANATTCDGGTQTTQYFSTANLFSEFDSTGSTKTSATATLTHC